MPPASRPRALPPIIPTPPPCTPRSVSAGQGSSPTRPHRPAIPSSSAGKARTCWPLWPSMATCPTATSSSRGMKNAPRCPWSVPGSMITVAVSSKSASLHPIPLVTRHKFGPRRDPSRQASVLVTPRRPLSTFTSCSTAAAAWVETIGLGHAKHLLLLSRVCIPRPASGSRSSKAASAITNPS